MNVLELDTVELARRSRIEALKMVHRAKASHIGSALSICDIISVLYGQILRVDPQQPAAVERDRFILSKGHACTALYGVLAEAGFFPRADLLHYGKDQSILMNHVSHKVPGIEFSTGSLGHGLPFAVGKAFYAKRCATLWKTYVVLSDGELAEGSNWEALLFAYHHKLDNLIAVLDYNKLQSLTTVKETLQIEPVSQKLAAFGWSVREVSGHDHPALTDALKTTPWEEGKPSFLVAHTTKGKGVSFMENSVEWHYRSPNEVQLAQALGELELA